MLDITMLNGKIGTLKYQRKELIEELGNITHTMYLNGEYDKDRLNEKCQNICDLDAQILKVEEEIKNIQIAADESLGKPKPIGYCECGSPILESDKFCGKCGKKVDAG
jgi:hypothetical protein